MPDPSRGSSQRPFGRLPDGEEVTAFTLRSDGAEVTVLTYGGILQSIRVPDRDGRLDDVVLGFDTLDGYLAHPGPYFGAVIGRYANRIGWGRFTLDGTVHELARNNDEHHLHGGERGFDRAVWHAEPFEADDGVGVALAHVSPDGDEGYPGTLQVVVRYTLRARGELEVAYAATTDRPTPVNLTQHAYFNLAGEGAGSVLGHELRVNGDRYAVGSEALIPTGELRSVEGTALDFRSPRALGERLHAAEARHGFGYDDSFVLPAHAPEELVEAAVVREPEHGRTLQVLTTEPTVHVYTGNFLDGTAHGKRGAAYTQHTGLCLETQHLPDSPNHPEFPSTILRPGEAYTSRTVFRFSAD